MSFHINANKTKHSMLPSKSGEHVVSRAWGKAMKKINKGQSLDTRRLIYGPLFGCEADLSKLSFHGRLHRRQVAAREPRDAASSPIQPTKYLQDSPLNSSFSLTTPRH